MVIDLPWTAIGAAAATATTILAIAWPILGPWIEKLVDRRLDYVSASRLETHKQKLDVLTEQARYDFQKKLANVGLHVARRHRSYAEAYRACRVAHGLIANQRGLRKYPTFEEYNRDDVVAYLTARDAPKGFIQEILAMWETDRQTAKSRLGPYARMLELQGAENAFIKAKNELYLNELYFSETVIKACNEFVDAGSAALAELEYPSSTPAPWNDVRSGLDVALEAMHTAMRAELSAD